MVPTVELGDALGIGRCEHALEVVEADRLVDPLIAGRGGVVVVGLDGARLPRGGDRTHVHHRPALLGADDRGEVVGNRDRGEDADDRHDDEQLDEGKALFVHRASLARGERPPFRKGVAIY